MSDAGEKRTRGRPRRADADGAILAATTELLRETGYAALNVDVVSERTGIAKTTIYRRWPGKAALVASVVDSVVPLRATTPPALLAEIATAMALLRGPDGESVEVLRPLLAARRDALRLMLPAAHADVIADALAGALLTRFLANEDVDLSFVERLLAAIGISDEASIRR